MVTVSSAFISSRRERIRFSVLSASGCAFKAAALVGVLRAVLGALVSAVLVSGALLLGALLLGALTLATLGKTDLDNTDVARDHSFHCTAGVESLSPPARYIRHVGLIVSTFQ